MATSNRSTSKNSKDTLGTLVSTLTGVIVGIKANLTGNKAILVGNQSTTGPSLAAVFQAFLDKDAAADTAKAAATQAVAARLGILVGTKQQLKQFTTWAVGQYGEAAYSMFSLPQPKVRTLSPTKKAIGIVKQKATVNAKKAALASIAPAEETLVALDTKGNAIGGSTTPTAAPLMPAAPPISSAK